jgi:hypothetical protein
MANSSAQRAGMEQRERNVAAHAQNSNTQKCQQSTLCENLFMTPNVSLYPAIKITI